MAICFYSNGIIEEFRPSNLVFTEQELIGSFDMYHTIRSKRIIEIPNTWCIWGEMDNPDPIEFNRLCTDITEIHIFSHCIFVHDSELNPSWNMSDMLYKNYAEFKSELHTFIDEMAQKLMEESEQVHAEKGENTSNMIYLTTAGMTDDKHVIYIYNPSEQSKDFYEDGSFANFSDRILEYLKTNFKLESDLTIFADKKVMINVQKENVGRLFNDMIRNFESKEQYETCSELQHMYNDWAAVIVEPKKKRGRPRKNKENNG